MIASNERNEIPAPRLAPFAAQYTAAALFAIMVAAPTQSFAQGETPAMPVAVAAPILKRVTQWDEYSGRFAASEMVEVRPRVTGFVDKIHFKDGQIVRAGDILFTIDPRPFEIAVDSAKAEVARTTAQVELAVTEVDRAEPLAKSRTITERDFDQRKANLNVTRAQQQAAQASLRSAELNLEWTQVKAPIAGRISDRKVDVGNLVSSGEAGTTTLLTTILRTDPIYFVFDISESDYLRYARVFLTNGNKASRDDSNPVRIRLADETLWSRTGKMDFVDNQLNPRSGTLRGRAILANKDELLTPGVFGRLQLFGGEIDALLIPDSAVLSDQARKIVFALGPGNIVRPVPVTLGPIVDGLRVVREGLQPSDRVIIDSLANPAVRPGVKVAPQAGEIKAVFN
jgi:membrane fusion protein, multidrug efflux system